jgi:peptidyl-prolyl cis-trans isomerase SurA
VKRAVKHPEKSTVSGARKTPALATFTACTALLGQALIGHVAPASAEPIERVVAVVNDEAVLLSDLRRRAAPYLEHAMRGTTSEDEVQARIKALYDQLAQQLVDEELIAQTARKMLITVASIEVDQAIENVRRQSSLEDAQFWEAVRAQGFTNKQYRDDVRKQLLRLKVINQRVRARVNITEDTVRDTYEDRVRQARKTQRFRASHVFLKLPETASATEVARVTKEAQAVRSKLTPETFDAAAEQHGGGELGWLVQGDLPAVLEEALLEINAGEIGAPVRGPSGVHIFLVRERQAGAAGVPTFEEQRAEIHRELLDRAMQRQEELFLKGLRRDAVITMRL